MPADFHIGPIGPTSPFPRVMPGFRAQTRPSAAQRIFGYDATVHGICGYDGHAISAVDICDDEDCETGLDYFGARYFSAAQGRFTSPDQPLLDQNPLDPQSWNLYTYARNNPLRYVDPTGQAFCSYGSGSAPEGGPATTEKACTGGGGTWVYQPTDTDDPNANAATFQFSVTKTENTGALDEKGQAVVSQLAENADPSMAMIGLVAGGSAAVGVTAGIMPVAGQAINELAFGPATGRLFWAGGEVAAGAAARKPGDGRNVSACPHHSCALKQLAAR